MPARPEVQPSMKMRVTELQKTNKTMMYDCGWDTFPTDVDWNVAKLKPDTWLVDNPGDEVTKTEARWIRPKPSGDDEANEIAAKGGKVLEFRQRKPTPEGGEIS